MMKLYDMAMAIDDPKLMVKLIDKQSRRICFEGNAEDLLDYSGLDDKRIAEVNVRDNVLELAIKNPLF